MKERRKRREGRLRGRLRKLTGMARRGFFCLLLAGPVLLMCAPVFLLLSGSIMSSQELSVYLRPLFQGGEGYISWRALPFYPTLEHYRSLLLYTPQFFTVFWNSARLVTIILAGQLLVGVPAAWGFAVYRFRGKKLFFTIYIVFMLLPFQVTMLSQYLVLDRVGVMNTHWAVILPAVFSTFPVFLIYRGFCTIPSGLLEAGRIDGAGEWRLFWQIGLPLASGGILSAMVLGFLEYWNMIEQPLAFLKDKSLWPLSLYLPEISQNRAGFAFAASVVTLVPSVFVFLLGQDSLEQGIVASALKE